MVSTRGVKSKFFEGEKVLCYEPDPTKARVLYDSKVLEVIINKDHRGRKAIEYLIHFQGWNSSWDRCVREEFVLKDTPENRQLQKELAQKSRLQIGTYLYRRESKKHVRKTNERTNNASSEDGSCGSPALMDDEDCPRNCSSSEEESSIDDDLVHIELTRDLRERLEQDYHFIKDQNKLHKLPAEPNVVTILELYWRQYASNQICCLNEKPAKYRGYNNFTKIRPEDLQKNLNICKEILDGIRIYFDFTIEDLLLYKSEEGQIPLGLAKFSSFSAFMKGGNQSSFEPEEYSHLPMVEMDELYNNDGSEGGHSLMRNKTRRRKLRSNRSLETSLNGHGLENCDSKSNQSNNNAPTEILSTSRLPQWRALPEHVYHQNPLPACLIYGATHLTRLFVKLPELLNNTNMPDEKLKVLLSHLNLFIE
ncbi:mortality factor 4-like protein [Holotrichia oblita]|uniref:Mortality factor 4-like protein n=1 Tax=Holotrichia oblita TaxID=644536 RepID=A0ACB9SW04_HOLOL|nr:mortality factor 4-like protein [Holotrichia oblita]